MKDFYDLYWITANKDLDQDKIRTTIKKIFARRSCPLPNTPPIALTKTFYHNKDKITQWNAFLRKNKLSQ